MVSFLQARCCPHTYVPTSMGRSCCNGLSKHYNEPRCSDRAHTKKSGKQTQKCAHTMWCLGPTYSKSQFPIRSLQLAVPHQEPSSSPHARTVANSKCCHFVTLLPNFPSINGRAEKEGVAATSYETGLDRPASTPPPPPPPPRGLRPAFSCTFSITKSQSERRSEPRPELPERGPRSQNGNW